MELLDVDAGAAVNGASATVAAAAGVMKTVAPSGSDRTVDVGASTIAYGPVPALL